VPNSDKDSEEQEIKGERIEVARRHHLRSCLDSVREGLFEDMVFEWRAEITPKLWLVLRLLILINLVKCWLLPYITRTTSS